jgi:hypothetical protein
MSLTCSTPGPDRLKLIILWQLYVGVDSLNLPDHLLEDASFTKLINQACSLRSQRAALRHSVAQRLRLAHFKEAQGQSDPEGVKALHEELRKADEDLDEVLVMINALNDAIAKASESSPAAWDDPEQPGNFERPSEYLSGISITATTSSSSPSLSSTDRDLP